MNSEEALAIVELALCKNRFNENRLNKLQKAVFCYAWEDQSYGEIARYSGYELGYVKQTGSRVWQLLSQVFNEKVTKTNVQSVLRRRAIAPIAHHLNPSNPHHKSLPPVNISTSAIADSPLATNPLAPAGISAPAAALPSLAVAFSPDGRTLANIANGNVQLWDVQTGTCIRTLAGFGDRVFSIAFSPDGQFLATGSADHLVCVWNLQTGKLLHVLKGHSDEVRSVVFSPSPIPPTAHPLLLASVSYDGTVRLWDAKTGEGLQVLAAHSHWTSSVAFSPDGRILATTGNDGLLRLWNVETGHCFNSMDVLQPMRTAASDPISALPMAIATASAFGLSQRRSPVGVIGS